MSRVSAVPALTVDPATESTCVGIGVNEVWWWRLGSCHYRIEISISMLSAWAVCGLRRFGGGGQFRATTSR